MFQVEKGYIHSVINLEKIRPGPTSHPLGSNGIFCDMSSFRLPRSGDEAAGPFLFQKTGRAVVTTRVQFYVSCFRMLGRLEWCVFSVSENGAGGGGDKAAGLLPVSENWAGRGGDKAASLFPVSENWAGWNGDKAAGLCFLFQKIGQVGVVTKLQVCVFCFRKLGRLEW